MNLSFFRGNVFFDTFPHTPIQCWSHDLDRKGRHSVCFQKENTRRLLEVRLPLNIVLGEGRAHILQKRFSKKGKFILHVGGCMGHIGPGERAASNATAA